MTIGDAVCIAVMGNMDFCGLKERGDEQIERCTRDSRPGNFDCGYALWSLTGLFELSSLFVSLLHTAPFGSVLLIICPWGDCSIVHICSGDDLVYCLLGEHILVRSLYIL